MILPIKHEVDWGLLLQLKKTQTNKYDIQKNNKRVDHDYKVGDKVMLVNNDAHKYKTPYKGPFVITQCWTNGMVTLNCDTIKLGIIYIA